jgi:hypothetical protein
VTVVLFVTVTALSVDAFGATPSSGVATHGRSATRWSAPADAPQPLPVMAASVIDLRTEAHDEPADAPTRSSTRGRTSGSTPAPTGPAAPEPSTGNVWAVVVGIDQYGAMPDLVSAGADAVDMANVLSRSGVASSHVRFLRDGAATSGAIESALSWLSASSDGDSTIVFFFAGHVVEIGAGVEAIVAADGVSISDRRVAQLLAPSPAGKAWIVIAGCYGGGFTEVLQSGRVLTAAAPAGALAYENDAYGRSYLAEFVLRRGLLEGRAGTTVVQEVVAWAQIQLAALHPNRLLSQTDWSTGPISVADAGAVMSAARSVPPVPAVASVPCPAYAICITNRPDG